MVEQSSVKGTYIVFSRHFSKAHIIYMQEAKKASQAAWHLLLQQIGVMAVD